MKICLFALLWTLSIGAYAQDTHLKVDSFKDFVTEENPKTPITFEITKKFVENYYVDFRLFVDEDTYSPVCFVGDEKEAASIVNFILEVSTGDSAILESELKVTKDSIVHTGTYTQGSGDFDSELDFEVLRCK